jgi:hypothetical protein
VLNSSALAPDDCLDAANDHSAARRIISKNQWLFPYFVSTLAVRSNFLKETECAPDWVWVAVMTSAFAAYFLDAVIHEFLGHGGACIVQGCHALDSSLWPGSAHFHCTCENAIFFAAGTLVSVGVWTLCTVILTGWGFVRLRSRNWFWLTAVTWCWWTFWSLGELILWALQGYSYAQIDNPNSMKSLPAPDVYHFIQLTGASPSLTIALALGLFALLFGFVFLPCLSIIRQCAVSFVA